MLPLNSNLRVSFGSLAPTQEAVGYDSILEDFSGDDVRAA
jgi:hypothetical protein